MSLRDDYTVQQVPHAQAALLIRRLHYSRGCANTSVAAHALVCAGAVVGAVLWMPPAAGVARLGARVFGCEPRDVLTLSRMAIEDSVPRNGASFLLARSRGMLPRRWKGAVTYADPKEGHTGGVYVASGWLRYGESGASTRWTDPQGRMRSRVCAGNLTVAEMIGRGWTRVRVPPKPRFLYPLCKKARRAMLAHVGGMVRSSLSDPPRRRVQPPASDLS